MSWVPLIVIFASPVVTILSLSFQQLCCSTKLLELCNHLLERLLGRGGATGCSPMRSIWRKLQTNCNWTCEQCANSNETDPYNLNKAYKITNTWRRNHYKRKKERKTTPEQAVHSKVELICLGNLEVTEHLCSNLSQSGFFLLQNGFVPWEPLLLDFP